MKGITRYPLSIVIIFTILFLTDCREGLNPSKAFYKKAAENALLANEGFRRCQDYVSAWMEFADKESGLIPENLEEGLDRWTPKNSAADNYPFMVLVSSLLDSGMFQGTMLDILHTETALTSRIGHLPDSYSFTKNDFVRKDADLEAIIFGASEYVKDGLLPLTEYLGPSPWSERMINITDDLWANTLIPSPFGPLPSLNVEVNGEQLQILSRLYWMTGEEKYLDWAIRLGDFYLLGENHPTRDFTSLRLNDHGCEIISGLCELYASVHFARPAKKKQYKAPVHEMLDRILEVGRNEHGLFYVSVNPKSGEILEDKVRDNWGYNFNGYYTVYQLDHREEYREALLYAFSKLGRYRNYDWETGSADGFADAIEGGLNLFNREAAPGVEKWIDSETRVMWSLQDSSYRENASKWKDKGIIEGWHGDGNFARTTIMYCLWKTQGITLHPWREDLMVGAVHEDNDLYISIRASRDWEGRMVFDIPRSKENMNLPMDWPRINQFPEWYTVSIDKLYKIREESGGKITGASGSELEAGLPISIKHGEEFLLKISEN